MLAQLKYLENYMFVMKRVRIELNLFRLSPFQYVMDHTCQCKADKSSYVCYGCGRALGK